MQPSSHSERTHARISGSKVARLMACCGSGPLSDYMPDESSSHANRGTVAHELAEWCLLDEGRRLQDRLGDTVELDGETFEIDQEMIDGVAVYVDLIRELELLEGAAVFLEEELDGGDDYPDAGGNADCIAEYSFDENGDARVLHLLDYKNGVIPVGAENNKQLLTYALLRDPNITYETYRFTIVQPNSSDGSEPVDTWECDAAAMREFSMEFHRMYEAVVEAGQWVDSPEAAMKHHDLFAEGEHCRFCPCTSQCPAKLRAFNEVVEIDEVEGAVEQDNDASTGDSWERIRERVLAAEKSILDLIKAVKARVYDELMNGEEVPGYKLVQGRAGNRKWSKSETEVLKKLQRQKIGKKMACTTKLMSPSALEKSLGKDVYEKATAGLVVRPEGSLTVAPESDKREAVVRKSAQEAFAGVEEDE